MIARASMLGCLLLVATSCDAVFGFELPASAPTDGRPLDDATPDADEGRAKHVFLTSAYSDGNLGGLAGADATCMELAVNAGLSGQFLAWLSDATGSPSTRMARTPGRYVLVNGLVIATSWEDLTDGSLAWPLAADEHGVSPIGDDWICTGGEVWSNTTATGDRVAASCNDWTTNTAAGSVGNITQKDARWTHDSACPSVICSSRLRFYCVEQ